MSKALPLTSDSLLQVLEHEVALVETDLNSEYIAQYENLKDMRDLHAEQIDQAEYQLLLNENRMLRIYKQAELAGGDWDKAEMVSVFDWADKTSPATKAMNRGGGGKNSKGERRRFITDV